MTSSRPEVLAKHLGSGPVKFSGHGLEAQGLVAVERPLALLGGAQAVLPVRGESVRVFAVRFRILAMSTKNETHRFSSDLSKLGTTN